MEGDMAKTGIERHPMLAKVAHFDECDGNGSVECWECGGEGVYCVATDDDPTADEGTTCSECGGKGWIRCPGCEAMDPPDDLAQQARR